METYQRRKAIFKDRSSKKLLHFVNGNSEYVRSDTLENCQIVLNYVIEEYEKTKKRRGICITELAQKTGLKRGSISSALHILCYREKPILRMFAYGKLRKEPLKIKTLTMVELRKEAKLN